MHPGRSAIAVLMVGTVAAGCSQSGETAYGPPSQKLIDAFNYDYRDQSPKMTIESVRPSGATKITEQIAAQRVNQTCSGGRSRIVAVGTVNTTFTSGVQWAVFYDPPGPHLAPTANRAARPPTANWYAGFVSVNQVTRPFCTFGYYRPLPSLPNLGAE